MSEPMTAQRVEKNTDLKPAARKQTITVNLFAGPGAGKSTTAAGVFHFLKKAGVSCELVREYAKDLTWRGEFETLKDQPSVFTEQFKRQSDVFGRVDVMITDSPLPISLLYANPTLLADAQWVEGVWENYHRFDNINLLLVRNHSGRAYDTEGRSQDEEAATLLDLKAVEVLTDRGIGYETVEFTADSSQDLIKVMWHIANRFRERMGLFPLLWSKWSHYDSPHLSPHLAAVVVNASIATYKTHLAAERKLSEESEITQDGVA